MGVPVAGKFEDETEADYYLSIMKGDGILPAASDVNVAKINVPDNNYLHVMLSFKTSSGEKVYYDPQSGTRLERPI